MGDNFAMRISGSFQMRMGGKVHANTHLAAANGDKDAIGYRDEGAKFLSPTELNEAKQLSAAWKPGSLIPEPTASKKNKSKKESIKTAQKSAKPVVTNDQDCPPKGDVLRYSDSCHNADCVRTFENGCRIQFQAPSCFDLVTQQWTWKPNGC